MIAFVKHQTKIAQQLQWIDPRFHLSRFVAKERRSRASHRQKFPRANRSRQFEVELLRSVLRRRVSREAAKAATTKASRARRHDALRFADEFVLNRRVHGCNASRSAATLLTARLSKMQGACYTLRLSTGSFSTRPCGKVPQFWFVAAAHSCGSLSGTAVVPVARSRITRWRGPRWPSFGCEPRSTAYRQIRKRRPQPFAADTPQQSQLRARLQLLTSDLAFINVAKESGLNVKTLFGGEHKNKYLLETTGCGVAFYDYDNDGWLDIFLVNGSRLEGFSAGQAPTSHLFKNNRDGTFTDVTAKAGVGHSGWGQGVCIGDYDNDGYEDLFVTYFGKNVLYHNNGNGTFTDVSEKAGVAGNGKRWNTGCAFVDYDRDGNLDLFVANYIDLDLATAPVPESGPCLYKGVMVACGPPGLNGGKKFSITTTATERSRM